MNIKKNLKTTFTLFLAAVLIIAPSLYAAPESQTNQCTLIHEQMSEWVKNNPAPSLDEMQALSADYQRAAFGVLSPESRSHIWQSRIDNVRETHTLTVEQDNLLVEMRSLMIPTLYDTTDEALNLRKSFEAFNAKAAEVFTKGELREIFNSLGAEDSSPTSPIPGSNGSSGQRDENNRKIVTTGSCECSSSSDFCFDGACKDHYFCLLTQFGCGLGWVYQCNGICSLYVIREAEA